MTCQSPSTGLGVAYHRKWISPDHNETPKIENMKKTTNEKIKISANCAIDAKIVEIKVRIDGREVKLLSGRNSLKVLIPDILFILGNIDNRLVMTTMKSSQFHASFR
jgi:hypothetical protein